MNQHFAAGASGAVIAVFMLVAAGCSTSKPMESTAPPPSAPPPSAAVDKNAAVEKPADVPAPTSTTPVAADVQPSEPSTTSTPPAPKVVEQPPIKTPPKAPAPSSNTPATKTPETQPTAPVASAAPKASAPAAPTLDMKSLEQRLRDTRAIGVMTKLSLKNQVDDLLDDFRAYYGGKAKTPLPELRQRYDLLLMKVLSLLQDDDAALASAISSSRESIWGILRDPQKFAEI